MEFSKKIDALLTLTATTNAKLAQAVNVDRSQISRMRTGSRERPRKNDIIRQMADYFSKHCTDEYRLSALEKLTNDLRIHMDTSEEHLSTILFDWLCSNEDTSAKTSTERFIYKIDKFSSNDMENQPLRTMMPDNHLAGHGDFVIYNGNSGKRRAMLDFFSLILSSDARQRLLVSSDEKSDWYFEDSHFSQLLSNEISACVKKGIPITHIYTANRDLDIAIHTIEQWIPGYMLGNIRQYYYPMHRDKLYRRTFFIMPGVAALYSSSLSAQSECHMTILTIAENAINNYAMEFSDVLSLCKPMTTVYTAETGNELFARMEKISAETSDSILKFFSLPSHTMPNTIMERICKEANYPLNNKVYENYLYSIRSRMKSLENYHTLDIIKLAPIDEIRRGEVLIPHASFFLGASCYYSPSEYREHLQAIVDDLISHKNYDVIISQSSKLDSLAVFGIGYNTAIIFKQGDPVVILEIDEPQFACALIEFLYDFAEKERGKQNKQDTIDFLKNYISQIY